MRTIKFRGRMTAGSVSPGRIVYGSLVFSKGCSCPYWIYNDGKAYPVDTDSVAQLIAVDKNGNEVYENDDIYLPDGGYYINAVGTWAEDNCTPFPASFAWYCEIRDGYAVLYKEATA